MTTIPVRRDPVGPLVVAGPAGAAHPVVGFHYLVGGLVVPGAVLARSALRRSCWTAAVPVVAAVVLVLTAVIGEQVLEWTA